MGQVYFTHRLPCHIHLPASNPMNVAQDFNLKIDFYSIVRIAFAFNETIENRPNALMKNADSH